MANTNCLGCGTTFDGSGRLAVDLKAGTSLACDGLGALEFTGGAKRVNIPAFDSNQNNPATGSSANVYSSAVYTYTNSDTVPYGAIITLQGGVNFTSATFPHLAVFSGTYDFRINGVSQCVRDIAINSLENEIAAGLKSLTGTVAAAVVIAPTEVFTIHVLASLSTAYGTSTVNSLHVIGTSGEMTLIRETF